MRELIDNGGFARNTRRGTGYIFNETALNAFLQTNQLTHLIRAHEMQPHGVSVSYSLALSTLFFFHHFDVTLNSIGSVWWKTYNGIQLFKLLWNEKRCSMSDD